MVLPVGYARDSPLRSHVSRGGLILNVGAGRRPLEPQGRRIISLDIKAHQGVDVVGDGSALPFGDEAFDGIVCAAVLEHVRDPYGAMREISRVMRPGAYALVDVPFLQGYHADPDDYQRLTRDGLANLIEINGLDLVCDGVSVGPTSALLWLVREYICLFFKPGLFRRVTRFVASIFLAPFKYLDRLLTKRPEAHRIASALYVIAKKR